MVRVALDINRMMIEEAVDVTSGDVVGVVVGQLVAVTAGINPMFYVSKYETESFFP